jgi:hypothetical protein
VRLYSLVLVHDSPTHFDSDNMDAQRPKSTGLSKQVPTALFEDMTKYFDSKHIIHGIISSFDKGQLLDSIAEAFDRDAFADAMFRDLAANLRGNMFSKKPTVEGFTECFDEQHMIDGILSSFKKQHIIDGIGDAFDKNAFAGEILRVVATILAGDKFPRDWPKELATEALNADNTSALQTIATNLTAGMFFRQLAASTVDKKTEESVPIESKPAVAEFQPTISMDATALRQQISQ